MHRLLRTRPLARRSAVRTLTTATVARPRVAVINKPARLATTAASRYLTTQSSPLSGNTNATHAGHITSVVASHQRHTSGAGWALAPGIGGTKGVVSVIGCPVALGQRKSGVQRGPEVIRNAGLISKLEKAEWTVEDYGDLNIPPVPMTDPNHTLNARNSDAVGLANKMLYEATLAQLKRGRFAVTLGGDHSIAIGSIAAQLMHRPETAVIWVDAHADLNTPKTSLSGNIHGMSVAFLMGLHNTLDIPGFEWLRAVPRLPASRIVYVGLRDLDVGEKRLIKELGVKAFTMQEVDRYGVGKVMEMALDHACARVDRPLHFSLDIDSVDPAHAPSTGTVVRGGLNYREAFYMVEAVAETGLLTAIDMVEVNPALADEVGTKMTVEMAVGLVGAAVGDRIL